MFELAQKIVDGKYVNNHHVTSFVGFFPASRPQVVLSVIVDDPQVPGGRAYGSSVAAPSFHHIAEQLIQYLEIKPVMPATPNSPRNSSMRCSATSRPTNHEERSDIHAAGD